jgi:hypothetical protein
VEHPVHEATQGALRVIEIARPFLAAHRIKVKRALFNEIATPGDGACDGRLPLRIDQTNVPLAGSNESGSVRAVLLCVVVAALVLAGCNAQSGG